MNSQKTPKNDGLGLPVDYYILPSDLRDGLLYYLEQKPYKEVHLGVKGLLSLEKVNKNPGRPNCEV